MGVYTTLKFKGIVKEEYRNAIDKVNNYIDAEEFVIKSLNCESEKWKSSGVDFMIKFAQVPFADLIPNGGEDFIWNKETGEWNFTTELKDYDDTYGKFFQIVPLFIESLETCKTLCEECGFYLLYKIQDNELVQSGEEEIIYDDDFKVIN